MSAPSCDDDTFIELVTKLGISQTSRELDVDVRNVFRRRRSIEQRLGITINIPSSPSKMEIEERHPQRVSLSIHDGIVMVASDAHYWPGIVTAGHRGFVKLCKKLKPLAVVMNGDIFDGASISRFPSMGWETKPTVLEEMATCKERLNEIRKAAPNADYIWPLGNHDARFESKISNSIPEFAGVHGVHLKDHFPEWQGCWAAWINDEVVIKHRFKGGDHAAYNNAIKSGKTIVTGHLHKLLARPVRDYNGIRWGVETGTLSELHGPQTVDYTEDSPVDWQQGFVVLTFKNGTLLPPECVYVMDDNHIAFRGNLIDV